jgi:hypothetical protein
MRASTHLLPAPIPNRPRPFSSPTRNGLGQKRPARGFFANSRNIATPAFAFCEATGAPALFAKTDPRLSDTPDETKCRPTRLKSAQLAHNFKELTRAATRLRVGMCVALSMGAMILTELFIIYLAAAAPFGVSRFLSEQSSGAETGAAFFKAAGAALAWPFTSLPRLLRRLTSSRKEGANASVGNAPDERRLEEVKRAAVNALRVVEDRLADEGVLKEETERHKLYAARECVERYAGLAVACAEASADARPTPREMELCRIAGRGGDDLLVAGRCVHRRNVTRLVAHRERASVELVNALDAVRRAARQIDTPTPAGYASEHLRAADPRRISEALSRAFSRVVELLSLFDERAALVSVARMLDAECRGAGPAAAVDAGGIEGEESCTTQAVPTAFVSPRLRTSTSRSA